MAWRAANPAATQANEINHDAMKLMLLLVAAIVVIGGFVALRYYQAYQRRIALQRKRQMEIKHSRTPVESL